MHRVVNFTLLVVTILYVFLTNPKNIEAYYLFDDFDFYDQISWSFIPTNNDSVFINNGILELSQFSPYSFPFLSKNLLDKDISNLEFSFKISGNPNFGAGIVVGSKNLIYGTSEDITPDKVLFMVWPKPFTGFGIYTPLCPTNDDTCKNENDFHTAFSGDSDKQYTFSLKRVQDKYFIFINNEKVFESTITNKKIVSFWIGSPQKTGHVNWPKIFVDYVKIFDFAEDVDVIIPGLGASWNFSAMLNGTSGDNWAIPNFIKTYDSLLKSFENVNHTKDKDLFVFGYDWRKPIDFLSDQLNNFIQFKIDDGRKINIIGHSMGGLIARDYAQKYNNSKINRIIMIGTPNEGSVDAYSIWEGAGLWNNIWWGKLAIESTVHLNAIPGETKVATLRKQIPSIRDLLPTFNYLYKNEKIVDLKDMIHINDYLINLNTGNFDNHLVSVIYGTGQSTKKGINIIPRTADDKIKELWDDGKPEEYSYLKLGEGDGTVLTESAKTKFSNSLGVVGDHSNLPNNKRSIEIIFDILGLDKNKIEITNSDSRKNVLAIFLRSPGLLNVCNSKKDCNDDIGYFIPEQKAFFMPDYQGGDITVSVKELGLGKYKIYFGEIGDEAKWSVSDGKLSNVGQSDDYFLTSNNGNFEVSSSSETNHRLIRTCKDNLNEVYPGWDKNNHIETFTNSTLTKTSRLRSFRLLQSLLSKLLTQSSSTEDSYTVETILNCWEQMNNFLVNIYSGEFDSQKRKHLNLSEDLLKITTLSNLTPKNRFKPFVTTKTSELLLKSRSLSSRNGLMSTHLSASMDKLMLTSYQMK